MKENKAPGTWGELAGSLHDVLHDKNTVVNYAFDNLELHVPTHAGQDPEHALWRLNGALSISTETKESKK